MFDKAKRGKNSFESFDNAKLSNQGKKLLKEWKKIEKLCHINEVVNYMIRKRNREDLPVEYEIIFNLNSIVGVEKVKEGTNGSERTIRKPVYANEHKLNIILPNNYPSAMGGNPEFRMISDTWHPNIRANGKFKGRICQNDKDLGIKAGLDERIIRVGKYLQFQMYWANDTYPWPEDKTVAQWIREEAEPMGWVNAKEGIYTDNKVLRRIRSLHIGSGVIKGEKGISDPDDDNALVRTKIKVTKIDKSDKDNDGIKKDKNAGEKEKENDKAETSIKSDSKNEFKKRIIIK